MLENAHLLLVFFGGVEDLLVRIDTVYDTLPSADPRCDAQASSPLPLPKKTKTIDFCILTADKVLAIQLSLRISEVDCASNPSKMTRNSVQYEWRDIHITTQPESSMRHSEWDLRR